MRRGRRLPCRDGDTPDPVSRVAIVVLHGVVVVEVEGREVGDAVGVGVDEQIVATTVAVEVERDRVEHTVGVGIGVGGGVPVRGL